MKDKLEDKFTSTCGVCSEEYVLYENIEVDVCKPCYFKGLKEKKKMEQECERLNECCKEKIKKLLDGIGTYLGKYKWNDQVYFNLRTEWLGEKEQIKVKNMSEVEGK